MKSNCLRTFFLTLIGTFVSTVLIVNLAIAAPFQLTTNLHLTSGIWLAQASETPSHNDQAQSKPTPPASKSRAEPAQPKAQPTGDRASEPKKTPPSAQAAPAKSGGPYDMKAIEEFYKSLYGS